MGYSFCHKQVTSGGNQTYVIPGNRRRWELSRHTAGASVMEKMAWFAGGRRWPRFPKWFFSRKTFIEQLQFTIVYKLLGTLRDIRHLLSPERAHLLVASDWCVWTFLYVCVFSFHPEEESQSNIINSAVVLVIVLASFIRRVWQFFLSQHWPNTMKLMGSDEWRETLISVSSFSTSFSLDSENSISFFRKGNTVSLQECGAKVKRSHWREMLKRQSECAKRGLTATKNCFFVERT